MKNTTNELLNFIDNSPTPFHAVENIISTLKENGFTPLYENDEFNLSSGGRYFITRNTSSIIAFELPKEEMLAFNIVASHSDSPMFKIKENPEIVKDGYYISLNTEKYGGMILHTWLDRPLSIAGRVIIREDNRYIQKLVNIDRDLLIIPSLAIHMDRNINEGKKLNPQTDMLPLFTESINKSKFNEMIASEVGASVEEVISSDLFLYNRQKGTLLGYDNEFIASPRLDDLQCVFASMKGFLSAKVKNSVKVLSVFDNEEVGSTTKQGADSTFLYDVLYRICTEHPENKLNFQRLIANSFMISADNAHALHPNNSSASDLTNRPILNGGVVIKHNANQKYTTDAVSSAIIRGLAKDIGIRTQTYHNRSDAPGGSTLGNIANSHISMNTVDLGFAQLAMHSSYETSGSKDLDDFILLSDKFYSVSILKKADSYILN